MPAADLPTIYGASYSVYVQALRLTLWAKGAAYELVEVDAWTEGKQPAHLARHPFGRIPAFRHGGVHLYETAPICRYVDEAFEGPSLQPSTPSGRASMGQAISIMDNYAYRTLVWGLYVEQVEVPRMGRTPDPRRLDASRREAPVCLAALDAIAPEAKWLSGDMLSLADLHAAPMFQLFAEAPQHNELMSGHPRLVAWSERIKAATLSAGILKS